MSRGVLLVNLGTPENSSVPAVRRYLGEFLMDRRVIDLPWLLRRLLVSGLILPLRPRRSARAYSMIWDAAGEHSGSPLLHYSKALHTAVSSVLQIPCELAMRYGRPDIPTALQRLREQGVSEVFLIALYPQHADSTRTSTIEAVASRLPSDMTLQVLPAFFDQSEYIDVQASIIARNLPTQWDHLLLSYHGLPQRHLTKADPTGSHCLQSQDCCQTESSAHTSCYRFQVYRTSQLLMETLGIETSRWSISFQSRLGRLPWITPYTDETLTQLPKRSIKHLVVACPAFVADNLETLEEIGITGRRSFLAAGGESFCLIPCLNADTQWAATLAKWAESASDARSE